MPWTDTSPSLPFAAGSQTSYQAAVDAVPGRELKKAILRELYRTHGPLSDPDVEALTEWPRSSICSIRNGIKDELVKDGVGKSRFGKWCDKWRLADSR